MIQNKIEIKLGQLLSSLSYALDMAEKGYIDKAMLLDFKHVVL